MAIVMGTVTNNNTWTEDIVLVPTPCSDVVLI